MAASDVTIVTKRKMAIYAYANLVCLSIQLGMILYISANGKLSSIQILFNNISEKKDDDRPTIPIEIKAEFASLGWMILILFQFLFVIRGLPCLKPGPHYVNTNLLKIRFSFCLLCCLLTLDLLSIAYLASTSWYYLMVPLIGFVILKLVVHYLLYLKVKYRDDGRELVTFFDFFAI